jgi:hypothetical protein
MILSFVCLFKIGIPFALKFHLNSISICASICILTFQILLIFPFLLEKFSDEEWANMPTCNMAEIVHNIWLQ